MAERAALITALILGRPLCARCIQERTGFTAATVRASLATIGKVLTVRREQGRCRTCGTMTRVLSLSRSPKRPSPSRRPA